MDFFFLFGKQEIAKYLNKCICLIVFDNGEPSFPKSKMLVEAK